MGTLIDAMTVMATRRGEIPLAVVTERGTADKVGVWLSRSMLASLFNEQRPTLGSKTLIKYDGTKVSPDIRPDLPPLHNADRDIDALYRQRLDR